MKVLSIKQPWASLICSGIKDVENRTWKPKEMPGRILIHAGSTKVSSNFFDNNREEYESYITNEIFYGNLPQLDTLPTGAIIGFVTVSGFEDDYTGSVWDGGSQNIKWKLEDAWLFDEPILNVKGKLNLFDYDLDENNLPPAHQVELEYAEVLDNGEDVVIPAFKQAYDEIDDGENAFFKLFLTDDLIELFCDQKDDMLVMKPFKTVTLVCDDKFKKFELKEDSGVFCIPDPQDDTKPYLIEYHDGQWGAWQVVEFSLGRKLDEGELVCLDDGNLIHEINMKPFLK